jgi:hypothetical protein
VSSNLDILNRRKESTFVISNRKQVIDMTLGINQIGNLLRDRHLSDEPSLSDHRYSHRLHTTRLFNRTKRTPNGTPTRMPSPVTTTKLGRPKGLHGGVLLRD